MSLDAPDQPPKRRRKRPKYYFRQEVNLVDEPRSDRVEDLRRYFGSATRSEALCRAIDVLWEQIKGVRLPKGRAA